MVPPWIASLVTRGHSLGGPVALAAAQQMPERVLGIVAVDTLIDADVKRPEDRMRQQVEANCDYVGPSIAEEARKIHYGESEQRNIYGETDAEQAKSLKDEGVEVQRIPWVPLENS